MAPPSWASLAVKVQFRTVALVTLKRPPPAPDASFPTSVQLDSTRSPALSIPPPLKPNAKPFEIVRLSILTNAPTYTVKTENVLLLARRTVTCEPAPEIARFLSIARPALVRPIV